MCASLPIQARRRVPGIREGNANRPGVGRDNHFCGGPQIAREIVARFSAEGIRPGGRRGARVASRTWPTGRKTLCGPPP
ncbi:predicted protein [Streptomyces sp. AA4]|nr:predicted protein [Streptomyces sp. AA4]